MPKVSAQFRDFILDQLSGLGGIDCRAMFGGYGLYRHERFFGIVYADRLYFKTDAASVGRYQNHGMQPFRPGPRQTLKNYYEVPVEILEDGESLADWAREAIARGN